MTSKSCHFSMYFLDFFFFFFFEFWYHKTFQFSRQNLNFFWPLQKKIYFIFCFFIHYEKVFERCHNFEQSQEKKSFQGFQNIRKLKTNMKSANKQFGLFQVQNLVSYHSFDLFFILILTQFHLIEVLELNNSLTQV